MDKPRGIQPFKRFGVLTLLCISTLITLGTSFETYEDIMRVCRTTHGGVRRLPSLRCDAYIVCFAGAAITRYCPRGTQFNADSGICDRKPGPLCRQQLKYSAPQQAPARKKISKKNSILDDAMFKVRSIMRSEAEMVKKMRNVIDSSPYRYVSAFLYAKPYAKYMSHCARVLLESAKIMKKRDGHINPNIDLLKPSPITGVSDSKLSAPSEIDYCPYPFKYICDRAQKYRTADGSCNNLQHPIWGRSNTPHRRLVNAVYADGIETMRRSVVAKRPLPAARHVSRHLFPDSDNPSPFNSLCIMIWGQFVDHDLTRTAISMCNKDEGGFGETEEVKCGMDGCDSGKPGIEACWPIPVSPDDPDFGHTNRCIKFVRSEPAPPLDCGVGHRESLNQVSQWLDGSNIYGSTAEEAEAVRETNNPSRGALRMRNHPTAHHLKALLPPFKEQLCRGTTRTVSCFLAGDERVNENSALSAMHTLWVREHNRIEKELHRLNPRWDGERLYQETRRIVSAMIQHIVVNEQLPLILGRQIIRQYDLEPKQSGYYYGYDYNYDPRVTQAFSTAAYRFGHTLIQDHFRRIMPGGQHSQKLDLSASFFRPSHIYDTEKGGVDGLLRGIGDLGAQTYDRFFTKQITKSLFTERPPHGPGMDLLSLNIQRGRDHGLGGYNKYREFCGLGRASTFDDLAREVPNNRTRAIIKRLYRHVDDIDLFPGGIAEQSVPGGVVGPTFACILGEQFKHARKGDRFWYENNNGVGFTGGQLAEIRNTRLARIICKNSDSITHLQEWVLLKTEEFAQQQGKGGDPMLSHLKQYYGKNGNKLVACRSLPKVDLRQWKE